MNNKKSIAIIPGSFDPITVGHMSIIEQAAEKYDAVYVAVMINDAKKYMFTLEERRKIAEACTKELDNVQVIASEGMLWELAKKIGATAIVKGYRNNVDLEYENKMAEFNSAYYPEAKTVLIKADEAFSSISSTLVRKCINEGISLSGLLSEAAIEEIKKLI